MSKKIGQKLFARTARTRNAVRKRSRALHGGAAGYGLVANAKSAFAARPCNLGQRPI